MATTDVPRPKRDMIVSNGKMDFLVHRVTPSWIYGIKYPTANRGDVEPGRIWLIKVTHETWDSSMKECREVVEV